MSKSGHDPRGRDGRHWTVLTPTRRYAARLYVTAALGGVLIALALVTVRGLAHSTGGLVAVLALGVAGLVSLGFAAPAFLVFRNLEDATVSINKPELVIGHDFDVRVEQRARRGLHIQEMRVALVCLETVRQPAAGGGHETRTVPVVEKWETLTRDKQIDHAKRMAATRTFSIPADRPASSPPDQRDLPLIRWKLRVVTTAAGAPTYDVDFPVRVLSTPAEGFWREINSEATPTIRRAEG